MVSVRAKPEKDDSHSPWTVSPRSKVVGHSSSGDFSFDHVYDGLNPNSDVFDNSVAPIIQQVIEGYNGTVFAYGMTGSGKTFSMQGDHRDPGMIPRGVDLLYALLDATGQPYNVKVSYLEIYNERVCDLLCTNSDPVEITLRDDPVRGVRAVGLTEVSVKNAEQLNSQISQGDLLRKTSSTQFNLHSSRSHAVVQVNIYCGERQSTLYLCDLAGSERAVSQMERRKEGAFINKSLLTLGTVISRLSTGGGGHVPFRDSKLTRLLQPSLMGNALVSVLCTIQTNTNTTTETLNTLRFAARAKNIVVMARRNSVLDDANAGVGNEKLIQVIEQQRLEIAQLKLENAEAISAREDLQGQLDLYMNLGDATADESLESLLSGGSQPGSDQGTAQYKTEIARLNDQINDLIQKLAEAQNELARTKLLHHPNVEIQELHDELSELKESLRDKDQVISYLRESSQRRQLMKSYAPSPASKSRLSQLSVRPSS